VADNPLLTGLKRHFTDDQVRKLGSVWVGIAGAGGLGSNVAAHLVRSGITRLVVADFDHVAPSNLNRQFYFGDQVGMRKVEALAVNLGRINPDVDMRPIILRLDAGNVRQTFDNCDIIVEALDDARAKKMIAEAFIADQRLLVCASGIGGWGNSDRVRTRRLRETLVIVGDGASEVSSILPATAAIVGLAAAKQADVVIENILRN
jgi:sulfur carrier protein ThiS adenylyltransferase